MQIKITQIRTVRDYTKIKAFVSITINDAIAVHDIKIIEGKEKQLVVFPSFRDKHNKLRNIIHPIKKEVRQDLDNQILAAFFIQQQKENDT